MNELSQSEINRLGSYSKSFITDVCPDLASELAIYYKTTLPKYPAEGVYIYSFKENKMLYADGWKEVVGYEDTEINMLKIVNLSAPDFAPFVNELNDKALMFVHDKTENLTDYSFTIELKLVHKEGHHIPVKARVRVFEADENGKLISIMGRFQIDNTLRFGKVMQYAAYGPEKSEFEEELNKQLFTTNVISAKEKEALSYVAKGYALKEIADILDISRSAVEKRILPLYKRFNLRSLSHLVSFAYENHILP